MGQERALPIALLTEYRFEATVCAFGIWIWQIGSILDWSLRATQMMLALYGLTGV